MWSIQKREWQQTLRGRMIIRKGNFSFLVLLFLFFNAKKRTQHILCHCNILHCQTFLLQSIDTPFKRKGVNSFECIYISCRKECWLLFLNLYFWFYILLYVKKNLIHEGQAKFCTKGEKWLRYEKIIKAFIENERNAIILQGLNFPFSFPDPSLMPSLTLKNYFKNDFTRLRILRMISPDVIKSII